MKRSENESKLIEKRIKQSENRNRLIKKGIKQSQLIKKSRVKVRISI